MRRPLTVTALDIKQHGCHYPFKRRGHYLTERWLRKDEHEWGEWSAWTCWLRFLYTHHFKLHLLSRKKDPSSTNTASIDLSLHQTPFLLSLPSTTTTHPLVLPLAVGLIISALSEIKLSNDTFVGLSLSPPPQTSPPASPFSPTHCLKPYTMSTKCPLSWGTTKAGTI